jgi:hypothetical protein
MGVIKKYRLGDSESLYVLLKLRFDALEETKKMGKSVFIIDDN